MLNPLLYYQPWHEINREQYATSYHEWWYFQNDGYCKQTINIEHSMPGSWRRSNPTSCQLNLPPISRDTKNFSFFRAYCVVASSYYKLLGKKVRKPLMFSTRDRYESWEADNKTLVVSTEIQSIGWRILT